MENDNIRARKDRGWPTEKANRRETGVSQKKCTRGMRDEQWSMRYVESAINRTLRGTFEKSAP